MRTAAAVRETALLPVGELKPEARVKGKMHYFGQRHVTIYKENATETSCFLGLLTDG